MWLLAILLLPSFSTPQTLEHKPWSSLGNIVSLKDRNGHFCSGTLLGHRVVLTAASCLYQPQLKLDSFSVDTFHKRFKNIPVSNLVFHPDYQPPYCLSDLALVFLSQRISFSALNTRMSFFSTFVENDNISTSELVPWKNAVAEKSIQAGRCKKYICVDKVSGRFSDYGGPVYDEHRMKLYGLLPVRNKQCDPDPIEETQVKLSYAYPLHTWIHYFMKLKPWAGNYENYKKTLGGRNLL